MPDVSVLPTAMQNRRQQLESEGTMPAPASTEPVANTSAPTEPAANTDAKVTISRDEFNELQAAAGKARAAEGRAEALRLDVEALTQRLTDLELASKGNPSPTPSAPAADAWTPAQVDYSDKENEDYGESKPFVVKVVNEVLNGMVPKLLKRLDDIEAQLGGVKTIAEGASKTATSVKSKSYTDQVREKVGNFDECVNHKHWRDFTESMDSDTGFTYAELIQNNFGRENVTGMVRIFDKFKEKYGVGKAPQPSGYEGGLPNNGGVDTDISTEPKKLPFSERKAAHKQYINKEITYEEYEAIRKKYDAADREGRVDYNK